MKTTSKLLAVFIGFVILQGIACASAQCSYIGVVAGDSYDFTISGSGMQGGLLDTLSGTMHVHIDNVTYGNPCTVGVTVTPSFISLFLSGVFSPFIINNGTFIVNDSSRLQDVNLVISKNVLNKTYYYNTTIFPSMNSVLLVTWDSNGMLNSIEKDYSSGSGRSSYNSQINIERVGGSTPGPEPFMFTIVFFAGIAIIILKKRGMSVYQVLPRDKIENHVHLDRKLKRDFISLTEFRDQG